MDTDFAKAVLCEAQLMREAAGMANELRTMNTKVRGKYVVQELEQKVVIEVERCAHLMVMCVHDLLAGLVRGQLLS